jgi:hypothetical protein
MQRYVTQIIEITFQACEALDLHDPKHIFAKVIRPLPSIGGMSGISLNCSRRLLIPAPLLPNNLYDAFTDYLARLKPST